jgi:RNA polymerase sigma-70 factor (ECF subfamily)
MEQTVEQLFERYRDKGETAALAEVFDRTAPEVLRVALHLIPGVEAAEDLLQTTFLQAIEHARRWDGTRPLVPWLLGILANQAKTHRRREQRSPDARRMERAGNGPGPEEAAQSRELSDALDRALLGLEEPYRKVLDLKLRQGLDSIEIARSLDRPAGTVRAQLHRGLDLLRKLLPVGFTLAGAGVVEAGRGLAEIRAEVLAAAAASGAAMTKKIAIVVAVLIALIGTLLLTLVWERGDRAERAPARQAQQEPGLPVEEPAEKREQKPSPPPPEEAEEEQPEEQGSLVVRVRWRDGGGPAAGVPLQLWWRRVDPWDFARHATTDRSGAVRYEGVTPGLCIVVSMAAQVMQEIEIPAGGEASIDLEIAPGLTVVGEVVDGEGAPVAAARILVGAPMMPGPVIEMGRSDEQGRFRVAYVTSTQSVSARAPGLAPAPLREVKGRPGDEIEVRLVLEGKGGAVRGIVLDEEGRLKAGARVVVGKRQGVGGPDPVYPEARAVTGADGTFVLEGVAPGYSLAQARVPGYAPKVMGLLVVPGRTSDLKLALIPGATVFGLALDGDGRPLPKVTIGAGQNAMGRHPQTFTDHEGRYRLEDLPAGRIDLVANARDGGKAERTVELGPGDELRWDLDFGGGQRIRGVLLDPAGKPQPGWQVRVYTMGEGRRWSMTQETGPDGRFSFEPPHPDAPHLVSVRPTRRSPFAVVSIDDVRAGNELLTIRLTEDQLPTASIAGRLLDPDGKPLGGARLHVWRGGVGTGVQTSHRDGRFRFGPVTPGVYRLVAQHGEHSWLQLGERTLERNQELDLGDVRFPVPGFLVVTVTRADGSEPKARCQIKQMELTDGPWASHDVGVFRSKPLVPGQYTLLIGGTGAADLRRDVEVRSEETTEVAAVLEPGVARRLAFKLPEGAPVPGRYSVQVTDSTGAVIHDGSWDTHEGRMGFHASLGLGRYTVKASTDTGLLVEATFDVTNLEATSEPIEFTLR